MTRILLTGKEGQVGYELQRALAPAGELFAYSRSELDLARPDPLRERVREVRPDWIVNAAAYTAVDQAESEEALATQINGEAPGVLAEEAKRIGAGFIHFSTDYVFAGDKDGRYVESDAPNPINAYGRSKLAGERRVQQAGGRAFIFRTSWVYAARGKNFLLTILKLASEKPRLRVVADQFGAPTSARTIANTVGAMLANPDPPEAGIYHLSCAGKTSWHGFAQAIVTEGAQRGLCPAVPVDPIPATDYPTPARRPANSLLAHERLVRALGVAMPDWQSALRDCLDELAADAE